MSTELDEAVARLKACVRPEHTWPFPDADVRLLLADWERRGERIAEFERLQTVWLMSPEAAKRLESYRELAAKCAALEGARAAARAEVERLKKLNDDLLTYQELGGTCAYCKVTTIKEEMPAHIEACAAHPMAAFKAELARLRERDAKVKEAVLEMIDGTPSLCARPCEGYCGFVHLRGCAAIKEWARAEWGDVRRLLKETP